MTFGLAWLLVVAIATVSAQIQGQEGPLAPQWEETGREVQREIGEDDDEDFEDQVRVEELLRLLDRVIAEARAPRWNGRGAKSRRKGKDRL